MYARGGVRVAGAGGTRRRGGYILGAYHRTNGVYLLEWGMCASPPLFRRRFWTFLGNLENHIFQFRGAGCTRLLCLRYNPLHCFQWQPVFTTKPVISDFVWSRLVCKVTNRTFGARLGQAFFSKNTFGHLVEDKNAKLFYIFINQLHGRSRFRISRKRG